MAFPASLDSLADDAEVDVVVIGAGGAGMSAALYAAIAGARVVLVESTAHVGGTTAYSAGTTWVPCTTPGLAVNPKDTPEDAMRFLDAAVGDRAPRALREAFVTHGAQAIECIEANTRMKYRARPLHPDYSSELPGSTTCGRAIEPQAFDGRLLGRLFALVRPPIPEFTVLRGMMVDRDDIVHLLGWKKSLASVRYVMRILARHALDRLRHPRGTRLLMGNALAGRLLLSLSERADRITLLMNTRLLRIERGASGAGPASGSAAGIAAPGSGAVSRVVLEQAGTTRTLRVRGGVILASGGFNRHPQRRAELLPGIAQAWSPGAPGHTGAAIDLALAIGARLGSGALSHAFWAPVSIRKRRDGSIASFPHFVFDRAKPGMVTVNQRGERFLNESTSYHLFGITMQQANADVPCIPAFQITDADGIRKYGLGMVRPNGMGLAGALADGYVTSASSLDELATKLGLPADRLQATIARINEFARTGDDPQFGRGTTLYQRANGDPNWTGPNPTLGPIARAPFYAIRFYPGDIGAATGLVTDATARVLDGQHAPIPGLYAIGNDMQSLMGGTYPAPGITIGPGLVFGYLAAGDAAKRAQMGVDRRGAANAAQPASTDRAAVTAARAHAG